MQTTQERRHGGRVSTPGGEAFCHVKGFGNRYLMEDLSTTGAKIRQGPMIPVGTEIEVVIFAGYMGLVSLDAHVVRWLSDGMSLAIEFTPGDEKAMHELEDLIYTAKVTDFWPTEWMEEGLP